MLRDHLEDLTAIRTQFGAIFVSLELSRNTWLMTSPKRTYFHRATRSLRAKATIAVFLRALVGWSPSRAKYQRVRADCG